MRRVLLIGTLGALLSVTGAQAGSKCGSERQALRTAASAVRGDESTLGRLHALQVRLSRSVAHFSNVAYHLNNAVANKFHEEGKVRFFLEQRCSGPTDLNSSAAACEAHRERFAYLEEQIRRLGEAEDAALSQGGVKQGELVDAQAREAVVRAQLVSDEEQLQTAKDALASCLAS